MERAVVLAGERQVEPARLPLHVQGSPALGINVADGFVASRNRLVRQFERQIAKLLEESRSNVSVAAKKARITGRNFHRRLTRHKLDARQFRPSGSLATP